MAGIECGKIDVTKLPEDEIISVGDTLWMKADVDEKIYIVNGNIPCVVVKFSSAPETALCSEDFGAIKSVLFAAGGALSASRNVTNITVTTANQQKAQNLCLQTK